MKPEQDAYGQAMLDYLEGERHFNPIIERDDGMIDVDFGLEVYFGKRWTKPEREALRLAQGRVLDVGAGAGRVALYLQERGHDVFALDNSPLAVKVMKRRGVRTAKVLDFRDIDAKHGTFDTVVMWGNNWGLFGSERRAKLLLRRLHKMTSADARIIAQTVDVYDTTEGAHLAYHRFNAKRGRMPGQLRIRVRYKTLRSAWFDYLMVSPEEMADVADGTGWFLERMITSPGSPVYYGVLEKDV